MKNKLLMVAGLFGMMIVAILVAVLLDARGITTNLTTPVTKDAADCFFIGVILIFVWKRKSPRWQ